MEAFTIEFTMNCYSESLEVYDGLQQVVPKRLAKLCGNLTHNLPTIKSHSNQMAVSLRMQSFLVYLTSTHKSEYKATVLFSYGKIITNI